MPQMNFNEGVAIHYEERGTGIPLVFIHGWGMSGRVWRFQHDLADGYRLVIPDLRGHGLSSSVEENYGFRDFAADLVLLFDRLQLSKAILVGWSMGAQVCLQAFSLLRPYLSALVLVSATPKFVAEEDYPQGLPEREVRGLAARLRRDQRRTLEDFFAGMFAAGELSPEQEQCIRQEISAPALFPDRQAALGSLAALTSGDHRCILAGIDLPALIIHGNCDSICVPGAARFMAEKIPAARLHLMEGVGHAPFLSRSGEFNEMVREFLRNNRLGTPR